MIAQAQAVFGETVDGRVRSAARRYTWGLVRAAIAAAARAATRRPLVWGYVENTLRNMREEGHTGDELAAPRAVPHFMLDQEEDFCDILFGPSPAPEVSPC